MLKRIVSVCVLVVGVGLFLGVGCGADDANEGDSCTSQGDCGGNLTCQPIQGRTQDYCCPTPATASTHANCQVNVNGAPSPTTTATTTPTTTPTATPTATPDAATTDAPATADAATSG